MNQRRRTILLAVVCLLWFAAAVTGSVAMWRYANRPGQKGIPSPSWPADSQISLSGTRAILVMFAHPKCPCSRASVGELAKLMADCRGQVTAHVWFFQPMGASEDWSLTDLWRSAETIPGVSVHRDAGAVEARRFHAATSGQTLLYDRQGKLLFEGGITAARGHAGDNPGRDAVAALLKHRVTLRLSTPVFGCSLLDPGTPCLEDSAGSFPAGK